MLFIRILSLALIIGAMMSRGAVAELLPAVVINELMWAGTSASSADEWIELRNTTEAAVDISGWSLTKKSGGQEVPMISIPAGSNIPPGGIWLISNYAQTPSSVLAVTPNLVTSDVALSNTGLQIKLYSADHVLIDTADDGSGNPLAGAVSASAGVYAAMERNPLGFDGTQGASWHTATRTAGLVDGAIELATPGVPNSNGRPVAAAGPDVDGLVGQGINFDGSDSADPEGQTLVWRWDFGDGGTSTDVAPTHIYSSPGVYTASLVVSDGIDEASDTLIVTINPAQSVDQSVPGQDSVPPVGSSCRGLELWSIIPNPVGSDETESVTVKNTTTQTLKLDGCAITAGTSRWTWPGDSHIVVNAELEIPYTQSRLRLPNAGGEVRLLDTDGQVLMTTTYSPAAEGAIWIRRGSEWGWKPGTTTAPKKKVASAKNANANKPAVYEAVKSVSDVQQYTSGDLVKISGTVTVPRNALGDNQVVIEDETGGCTVVIPAAIKTVNLGDRITVTGVVRTSSGRRRVVAEAKGFLVTKSTMITPRAVQVVDIGVDDTERLIKISGAVSAVAGSRFEVDDGTEVMAVILKSSTRIVRPRMTVGDTVSVVGIVSAGTTGLRLYPRQIEDIQLSRVLGATASSRTAPIVVPTGSSRGAWWYWGLAGGGFLAINARRVIRWWRQRQA